MAYCAPDDNSQESYRKDKTCFGLSSLHTLAEAWNRKYGNPPIKNIRGLTKKKLLQELNERMKNKCRLVKEKNGLTREGCWVDVLGMEEESDAYQDLRPPRPEEWYENPRAWLSNFDIEDVMEQYENEPDYKYNFLGVFPMDFADIYQELNEVRWENITKNGKCKYIGMVTNLDDHDEPGSHWTSLFAVCDPTLPSFGVYYYDSVSNPPTPEIKEFMIKLMKKATINALQKRLPKEDFQVLQDFEIPKYTRGGAKEFMKKVQETCLEREIKPPRPFKMEYNTHQHQYKNTECGIFSIVYQIRWLEGLRENEKTTFQQVVSHRMKDEEIAKFRDRLFRPNTKALIKKGHGGKTEDSEDITLNGGKRKVRKSSKQNT